MIRRRVAIDYVNAHGTGTILSDRTEIQAIRVPNQGRPMANLEYAMSNSFAFGGTSAVLIARRH